MICKFISNKLKIAYIKLFSVAKEPQKCKMYTDFFKRKPSRAAVWRTLPPLSKEEMNLNQKADAVTEKVYYHNSLVEKNKNSCGSILQIATDFIDWLKNLGGDEELSLTVQDVIEMFEVGFHANAASSLKVVVKELPSVPRKVADAQHVPKVGYNCNFYNPPGNLSVF